MGIFSPVIGIDCRYQHTTTFDDRVSIRVWVEEFKGVKLIIGCAMANAGTGQTVLTARSTHCFTTPEGKPVILKKQAPELDRLLRELAAQHI